MIKIQFIGNLGADCEQKEFEDGSTTTLFSVAVKHRGEGETTTQWVRCRKPVGNVDQYLKKGKEVYVEGVPSTSAWMKDGQAACDLRCRVTNIQLIGGRE